MYAQTTAMATKAPVDFVLPDTVGAADFSSDEVDSDLEGLTLRFPQIKIPSGGTIQFEIPTGDPDDPAYTKELVGVILCNHDSNAYWPVGDEYSDNVPPLCQSVDGKEGFGTPGGLCAACVHNQFGTGKDGKGKACKNMRVIYLLQSGDLMPVQLALPPTSLGPYSRFVSEVFATRRRPLCSAIVKIGLKKVSSGGYDYSVATFSKVADFEGEQLAQIRAYASEFKKQVGEINRQRAEANQAAAEIPVEVEDGAPSSLPDNTGSFAASQVVYGDKDGLPD